MQINILVEDTAALPMLRCEHGLSIYIESNHKRVLFDLGSSNLFCENAEEMEIYISDVDLAVISHGHYDHGGGLETFLAVNKKAPVYVSKKAFRSYYANSSKGDWEYAGIDRNLADHTRLILTDENMVIDENMQLFSNVTGRKLFSSCNDTLYQEHGGVWIKDDFQHEQNLIIREGSKSVLFAGCAHNGIVNILEHVYHMEGRFPDYVISGFHLVNSSTKRSEDPLVLVELAKFLQRTNAKFYTGHCTGIEAYEQLHAAMGDQIEFLSTGMEIELL